MHAHAVQTISFSNTATGLYSFHLWLLFLVIDDHEWNWILALIFIRYLFHRVWCDDFQCIERNNVVILKIVCKALVNKNSTSLVVVFWLILNTTYWQVIAVQWWSQSKRKRWVIQALKGWSFPRKTALPLLGSCCSPLVYVGSVFISLCCHLRYHVITLSSVLVPKSLINILYCCHIQLLLEDMCSVNQCFPISTLSSISFGFFYSNFESKCLNILNFWKPDGRRGRWC